MDLRPGRDCPGGGLVAPVGSFCSGFTAFGGSTVLVHQEANAANFPPGHPNNSSAPRRQPCWSGTAGAPRPGDQIEENNFPLPTGDRSNLTESGLSEDAPDREHASSWNNLSNFTLGTMHRLSCPLITNRLVLVAMSSGKVLPKNMDISPTNRGTCIAQRSCNVRSGGLAAPLKLRNRMAVTPALPAQIPPANLGTPVCSLPSPRSLHSRLVPRPAPPCFGAGSASSPADAFP